jgi:site-specific recombinase XerC
LRPEWLPKNPDSIAARCGCIARRLSPATVRELLSNPDSSMPRGIRDRAILCAMAMVGLGVLDVHLLDTVHVDLPSRLLCVEGRGGRHRTVPLTGLALRSVEKWIKVCPVFGCGDAAFLLRSGEPSTRREVVSRARAIGSLQPRVTAHPARE